MVCRLELLGYECHLFWYERAKRYADRRSPTSYYQEGMTCDSKHGIQGKASISRYLPTKGVLHKRVSKIITKCVFRFDAGVTSIQSHPNTEHLIAVGSYDCTVRLFDTRKLLTSLAQADVGGGAWRVKWHPSPSRSSDLLVAAMHDGFKVVRFFGIGDKHYQPNGFNENWEIQKRYDGHASLAYGVDWSYQSWQDQTLVASASFYDHALHLW